MLRPRTDSGLPMIRDVGLTGLLVSFADRLGEPANRAALAFRAAVDAEGWDGVQETATSLTSVFLRFDPLMLDHDALRARLDALLAQADWRAASLPRGRRLWRIPAVLGGTCGPQFAEAAKAAGLDVDQALKQVAGARVRVLSIGFAPGQPYMGELPEAWDIPRMQALNPQVPEGALVVAIRQLIIFARPAPTGWRHIGQTAFRCFRPEAAQPFALRAGDEVTFRPITPDELDEIAARDTSGDGGAVAEVLT